MSRQDGSNRLVSLPGVDDSDAHVLHVDLDAFFASASLLAHPELVGKPVVVGQDSSRSVVTAATYEARKYGVYSAMPMARAKQLCPRAVILAPDFALYKRLSAEVMAILADFSPNVEQLGIDEAFVDVAGARKLFGGSFAIGAAIRERVRSETGLVASVGIAATKFIAKVASQRAKPDGMLVIPPGEVLRFLAPQPLDALWGVGPATRAKLEQYGLRTVGDVASTPLARLQSWIGVASGAHVHNLSRGIDERMVRDRDRERSIGHDHTFGTNVTDRAEMRSELLRLASGVGKRVRAAGVVARTVTIRIRYADFTTISRSRTLKEPTDVTRVIAQTAWMLLDQVQRLPPVRLLGVQASSLSDPVTSMQLWDDSESWHDAERAMDRVHERFGAASVAPASMLRRERKREDLGR